MEKILQTISHHCIIYFLEFDGRSHVIIVVFTSSIVRPFVRSQSYCNVKQYAQFYSFFKSPSVPTDKPAHVF